MNLSKVRLIWDYKRYIKKNQFELLVVVIWLKILKDSLCIRKFVSETFSQFKREIAGKLKIKIAFNVVWKLISWQMAGDEND